MARRRNEGWRWKRDEDGWLCRPILRRDALLPRAWHEGGEESLYIGTGWHAFIEGGMLYCRNRKQRNRLDRGLPV